MWMFLVMYAVFMRVMRAMGGVNQVNLGLLARQLSGTHLPELHVQRPELRRPQLHPSPK